VQWAIDDLRSRALGDFVQQVYGTLVLDGVHGIQPQSVEIELAQHEHGVLHEELPHRVTVFGVEIQARAPGRVMALRKECRRQPR
jgi:hypothetical protein